MARSRSGIRWDVGASIALHLALAFQRRSGGTGIAALCGGGCLRAFAAGVTSADEISSSSHGRTQRCALKSRVDRRGLDMIYVG